MHLPEIDRLTLTSVVDNYLDPLLGDEGPARRRRVAQARSYERCLCSEHGLAEHLESQRGDERFSVLFDFSATPGVYLHNLALLEQDHGLDLKRVGTLVLSHGHWDHYGGLTGLVQRRRDALHDDATLYSGEDAFLHRWSKPSPQGTRVDSGALDEAAIAAQRVRIAKVRQPQVLGGQVLISGEIPRRTAYEAQDLDGQVERDGRYLADALSGEQALIYHLRGKGLVVLTACGHAGVVNTVLHAREVTGVPRVHAVVGGFHLSGAPPERIAQAVQGLAELDPDLVIPMHCTGMATIEALRARLPGRVIHNSAGTQYELLAA